MMKTNPMLRDTIKPYLKLPEAGSRTGLGTAVYLAPSGADLHAARRRGRQDGLLAPGPSAFVEGGGQADHLRFLIGQLAEKPSAFFRSSTSTLLRRLCPHRARRSQRTVGSTDPVRR